MKWFRSPKHLRVMIGALFLAAPMLVQAAGLLGVMGANGNKVYLKGGVGVDVFPTGEFRATGVAVPISIQPFSNLSGALRGKYTPFSFLDVFYGYTSTARVTEAQLAAELAQKSPLFPNYTTLARFGAGPTYNGLPIGSGSGGTAGVTTFNTRSGNVLPAANDYSIGQIAGAAAVASTGSYSDLSGAPVLAPVATSGAYADLTGKPSLAAVAASGSYLDLTNKPTLSTVAATGSYTDLLNKPAGYTLPTATTTVLGGVKVDGTSVVVDGAGVISSTVSAGVSSFEGRTGAVTSSAGDYAVAEITGLQTALDGKAATTDPRFPTTAEKGAMTAAAAPSAANPFATRADLAFVNYSATAVSKISGGAATGALHNTHGANDTLVYQVQEASGTPGFDVRFTFAGAGHFNQVSARFRYDGATTHDLYMQIYNYGTLQWDDLHPTPMHGTTSYAWVSFAAPDNTAYVSGGPAQVRFYHTTAGNPAHALYVDYIVLQHSTMGGATTLHSQLAGRSGADQHPTSAITGLDTALASKHDTSAFNNFSTAQAATDAAQDAALATHKTAANQHPISGVTGLSDALAGKQSDLTGASTVNIGSGSIGSDKNVYIDLHADTVAGYDARLIRNTGTNGALYLSNYGTGATAFYNNGVNTFYTTQNGPRTVKTNTSGAEESTSDLFLSSLTYTGQGALPATFGGSAIHARTTLSGTGPIGTVHALSANMRVTTSGNADNEFTPLFTDLSVDAIGRAWGSDQNIHGPYAVQSDLLLGSSIFVNNYNASAIPDGGYGQVLTTHPGRGGGDAAPDRASRTTYPLDAALAIVGKSGAPGSPTGAGFNTAIRIGGGAGGWMGPAETSIMGTGITLKDAFTGHGIDTSAATITGSAIKVSPTQTFTDGTVTKTLAELAAVGGAGDVTGPASSTNNAVALFNGIGGKIIKDSAKTIVTSLGSDDASLPTSKAVKDVTDTKAPVSSPTFAGPVAVNTQYGNNLAVNGTFDTDLSGWVTVQGWSWDTGTAKHTSGDSQNLSQSVSTIVAGNSYKIVFDIKSGTTGYIQVTAGGITSSAFSPISADYTVYLTAISNTALSFIMTSTFDGSIDNVRIYEATGGGIVTNNNLRITPAGWVSIGSSSITSSAQLEVTGGAGPQVKIDDKGLSTGGAAGGAGIGMYHSNATGVTASGDRLGYFLFGGSDGTAMRNTGFVGAYAESAWSAGLSYPTYLRFETNDTSATSRTERMRITAAGNVGIGTTSPGEKLDVAGNLRASAYIISGHEEQTTSYTVSKDSSKIALASGTATVTLPASLPAGHVAVTVTVTGAAASGVSFSAAIGGSVSFGDAGTPVFTNSKTADVVCHSQNTADTTTAAWRCVKGGNY